MSDRLKVGDAAPPFNLPDQSGHEVSLSSFRGRKVLVFFYPKADTPGCTTVIGISPGPPKRQAAFDTKFSLGFPLLSDVSHTVAESYAVWVERSMYGRTYMGIERSAFLVSEDGTLGQVWYKVGPAETAENLLKALAK
jgi:peroxiredoxin Q/BCP